MIDRVLFEELYVKESEKNKLLSEIPFERSLVLTQRQLCDLELLMDRSFFPLDGFLGKADYESVLSGMRLTNGEIWPIPINLDVSQEWAGTVSKGDRVRLLDLEGVTVAVLEVSDIWQPDKEVEARSVFGTNDDAHPGVHYLMNQVRDTYLGGRIYGISRPTHYDFVQLRDTPNELRTKFNNWRWDRVVAFQTRNPMHRAHQEITLRAAREVEANLLIQPVVGMTKPGDIDHFTRVRCYQKVVEHYPLQTTSLSLLNLAMRMAGPREALWHALIRKNYGCTHFIVGRDHAGPGKDSNGNDFYGPYDAQELVEAYQSDIGIEIIPFKMMCYVSDRAEYIPVDEVAEGEQVHSLSGTEFRRRLREGLEIPDWFSFPSVVRELQRSYPPQHERGFTVFFTGLSGSGKSTIANALMIKLMEAGGRQVTLLDGDVVRTHLSSELGFSKEHRDLNIRRIGYVASEITKNRGVAICAPIAPYEATRRAVREMIEEHGGFFEVYVSTPLEECERRDRKGLYAAARAGKIKEFTGISDPYEEPIDPELSIDTTNIPPDEAVQKIILKLKKNGFLI